MERLAQAPRPLLPWYDPYRMTPGHGGPVNWERVSSFFDIGKFTVKLSADAAIGAETLAVDPTPKGLFHGTILDFGEEPTVTVELTGNEAIGQTDIGIKALTGALPSGTILYFGTGEFMRLTAPAIVGATSLTVEPLEVAVESGDTATYRGGRKIAKLTEDAEEGATSLAVEPLQFAIADNSESLGDETSASDGKRIPAGTVMSKDADGLLIPRRDADTEQAVGFIVSDANEKSQVAARSGYGLIVGGIVYENLLPDAVAGDIPAGYKTELAANTLGFLYQDWEDSRVV